MSATIAALIAHAVFWGLIALGLASGELSQRAAAIVSGLWLLGFFGLDYVAGGTVPFASYVAVLDVALVFIIFKGDVNPT